MQSQILDEYYSDEELAKELEKSTRTIKTWRALCIGPPTTYIGKTPYTRKDAVPEWLRNREKAQVRAAGAGG